MPVDLNNESVILYDSLGVELAVSNGVAIPVGTRGLLVAATDGTNARFVKADGLGRLIVTSPAAIAANGLAYGTVITAATTNVPVRASTYNEPAANAQRSISSANAADTAAGTGARQVQITYYTVTGTGPFTETVTLNGVAAVNTVATNICFIEKIVVVSVGSGGQNAGVLTLFNAAAGAGGTLATVNAGDNQTLWAQHYVATGVTCNVTGVSGNNTNASNASVLSFKAKPIGSTAPERQVSDTVRVGASTSQPTRIYQTPVQITGPARVLLYTAPEGTPNITTRASFDFYDQ